MDKDTVTKKLTTLARQAFNNPDIVLSNEMTSQNVEGWTSLAFTQLLLQIEQEFHFKFKITELLSIQNMGNLIAIVVSHSQSDD